MQLYRTIAGPIRKVVAGERLEIVSQPGLIEQLSQHSTLPT